MIKIRPAHVNDTEALAGLIHSQMVELFDIKWGGSVAELERDGFGKEFESVIAESPEGSLIGFGAWMRSYDLHHCISGGVLMDLYVEPKYRGKAIALAIIVSVAQQIHDRGGHYLRGKAIPNKTVERFYDRVAVSFPGTEYNVGGRAFRCLSELSGHTPREMLVSLPQKEWNYEP
jgi:GNAT superfamily N-acetyltransferase